MTLSGKEVMPFSILIILLESLITFGSNGLIKKSTNWDIFCGSPRAQNNWFLVG